MVMQHVPLRDRLTNCCLVNRRLHAAAVAATDQVMLATDHMTTKAFRWLASYGHHVTKLHVDVCNTPLQQLPCPNLQELKFNCCSVQLEPTAGGQGIIEQCIKLTRLDLSCHIMDNPRIGGMSCLDRLQQLQHLHVHPRGPWPAWHPYTIKGLPSSTLPCLQQLTYLSVQNLSVENLPQLGSLTRLQGLSFGVTGATVFGPSTVHGLVFPDSLTSFHVQTSVEGGVLSMLPTRLRVLELGYVVQGPIEGLDLLLSGVARQQHLTRLSILSSEVQELE